MNTKELLKIVYDRGLKLALKDGQPVIRGANGNGLVTSELLAVLKIHREHIIEILKGS